MLDGAPRRPGEHAASRARREWRISGVLLALMVLGVAASVLSLTLDDPIYFALPTLVLVYVAGKLALRRADEADPWTLGARSEQVVGGLLDTLRDEGYVVMHDVPQPYEGNVDHLVNGPAGVFMVETKYRRYEERHLTKAKRQAAKLHDELGLWVTPVICLDRRQRPPFRHQGVWVMSADHLLGWIRSQRRRAVEREPAGHV